MTLGTYKANGGEKVKKLYDLKAYRAKRGKTQREMAEALGMTLSTYNFKENGRSVFTQEEISKILAILGGRYEDIFS